MLVTDARQAIMEEAPLERLRSLTGELQQALQGLMLAGGGAGGGQQGGPSQPPPGGDDDVIDADFTPS
jgi:molecular chaperone DnaK